MFAGIDFPSYFEVDRFTARRSGTVFASGNPYDPESLLTGAEADLGYTYDNSSRRWPNEYTYLKAVSGNVTTEEILKFAPRVFHA